MQITIKQLQVDMPLGVHDWEKQAPQVVHVTLTMRYDGETAATTDDIESAINYDTVVLLTRATLKSRHYELIESAAQAVLGRLMEVFPLTFARVEIEKPHAIPLAQGVIAMAELQR